MPLVAIVFNLDEWLTNLHRKCEWSSFRTCIRPLAFVAAARVDERPAGANEIWDCFDEEAGAFFFAGAFLGGGCL